MPGSLRCPASGSRVIARGRSVRVYSLRARGFEVVRACMAGGPTMTLLGGPPHPGPHHSIGQFRLAGNVLAYLGTTFGVDSGSSTLNVVDVGKRRTLQEIPVGSYVDAGIISSEAVTELLPTSHGSVAWIARRSGLHVATLYSVHVAPRAGAPSVLAEGAEIDGGSLALSGHEVSWTDAGTRHSAPMP